MSYPPYQPPQPNYPDFNYYQPDVLAPARRAANLMFVLGGVGILASLCCVGAAAMVPQMMQQPEFANELARLPGVTADFLRIFMIVLGGISVFLGVLFVVLGTFVRRGSKAATIVAMVLAVMAALFFGFELLGSLVHGVGAGPKMLAGVCIVAIPLVLMILLITWLAAAMRASDQVQAQRYAMGYWQYAQQQQQMYGQPPPQPPQPPYPPYPPMQQPPAPPPPPNDQPPPPPQA